MGFGFNDYIKAYKSLWGLCAAALGLSGPFFKVFNIIAPPIELISGATVLIFVLVFMVPYLLRQSMAFASSTSYRIGLLFAIVGIPIILVYAALVYPEYVYSDQPRNGPKRRAIIASDDYYSEQARAFIRTNDFNAVTRKQIVECYQLPNIPIVFTKSGLYRATLTVGSIYVICIFCLEAAFCFLALGDALAKKAL